MNWPLEKQTCIKGEKKSKSIYQVLYDFSSITSLVIDGILITKERKLILEKNIQDLLDALKKGVLKPLEVLQAYQAKALSVDEDINAVCDFILEATDWAVELESISEEDRGPLYGLPISIKVEF